MNNFKDYFDAFSDRPCLKDDLGNNLSYLNVLELGLKIIGDLRKDKSLVFLKCLNNNSSVACYFSLLAAEHAVLLLDSNISEANLAELIKQYKPDYIIDPEQNIPVTVLTNKSSYDIYDDLSIMLTTSGSTGSAKVVCFTEKNLLCNAKSICEYLELDEQDTAFAHLPLHYSFGLSVLNSHIISGSQIRLTNFSLMQKEFWSAFNESETTSFYGVPFHFEMLKRLRHPYRSNSKIRYLAQAGGRLSETLVVEYATLCQQNDVDFFVMYGQTEAGPRISYLPSQLAIENSDSIGIPIPGVQLEVLDPSGDPINTGEIGELVCYSPSVMLGYASSYTDLKNGDQLNGVLKTGDLGSVNEGGLFSISGRSNRFLKVQGVRVGLDDIEAKILNAGYIVACIGEDDLLTLAIEAGQNKESLREFTNSEFKISPRSIHFVEVDQIPRKSTGKIDYQQLKKVVQLNP